MPKPPKSRQSSIQDLEIPPDSSGNRMHGSSPVSNNSKRHPHRKTSSAWGSNAWSQLLAHAHFLGKAKEYRFFNPHTLRRGNLLTPLSEGHEGTLENYNAAREKKIPESQTAPAKLFGQRTYTYSPTLPASQEIPTYTTSVSTSASPRRRMSLKSPSKPTPSGGKSTNFPPPTPVNKHQPLFSHMQLSPLTERVEETSDTSSPLTGAEDEKKEPEAVCTPLSVSTDNTDMQPPSDDGEETPPSSSAQEQQNVNRKELPYNSGKTSHHKRPSSIRGRLHSRKLTEIGNWLFGRLQPAEEGEKRPAKKVSKYESSKPKDNVDKFHQATGYTRNRILQTGCRDDAVVLARSEKPDPQKVIIPGVSYAIKAVAVFNLTMAIIYMHWRWNKTIQPMKDERLFNADFLPALPWAYTFFIVEVTLIIAVTVGHTQRLFPVERSVVTMDELAEHDMTVAYNAKTSIIIPTAGESMDTYLYCILGAMSQLMWPSPLNCSQQLKIIILDEKRRREILHMTAAVYALCTMLCSPSIIDILTKELVECITVQTFHKWWKDGGYARKWLYDDPWLNKACLIMEYLVKRIIVDNGMSSLFNLNDMPKDTSLTEGEERKEVDELVKSIHGALNIDNNEKGKLKPAYIHQFDSNPDLPTVIYYTRRECGTPKASPKAGNLNAAIFPMDFPDTPPLVGDSNLLVVNDCRHKLHPMFLQRTLPYFFKISEGTTAYAWDTVAFVQTPQRFVQEDGGDDPLGNNATIQFDVINRGKDGIAAVSSAGHGSVWRIEALRGKSSTGEVYCNADNRAEVGYQLGFRAQLLIEDTHTSIDMFRQGWGSRYINEPGEWLSSCSKQPDNVAWRIKQVLRWHQGAVQLMFYIGLKYVSFSGDYPTVWHRIYGFDQATYYLQAIPGFILTIMPIIYGISGVSPFSTEIADFFIHFTPYIITASLPTLLLAAWRGVETEKLHRDEQTWLSTCYVQIYAFFSMLKSHMFCKAAGNAWATKIPKWPLFSLFLGQFIGIAGALYWVSVYGFNDYSKNFCAVMVSSALVINALWPMVSMHLGFSVPSTYYMKLLGWLVLTLIVIIVDKINTDED